MIASGNAFCALLPIYAFKEVQINLVLFLNNRWLLKFHVHSRFPHFFAFLFSGLARGVLVAGGLNERRGPLFVLRFSLVSFNTPTSGREGRRILGL